MGCEERTRRSYNLHICDIAQCDGDMPYIRGTRKVPESLQSFNDFKKHIGGGCHFFLDDYRIERLWRDPERYAKVLARYDTVLSPDFSQFYDMPAPMRVWNEYRKRALQNYWERCGIDVVPTLSWSDRDSYGYCFGGIPRGSTVAISTVGSSQRRADREAFQHGLDAAIAAVRPAHLVVYGRFTDYDWHGVPCSFFKPDTMGGINGR